ncbi:MAG: lytic transglycosylase domain-containing protein [Desulfobacterota bacterium]|nr:lytic transglycosylase domain-containing protein [Thermodesulfobacteriota bacterium]
MTQPHGKKNLLQHRSGISAPDCCHSTVAALFVSIILAVYILSTSTVHAAPFEWPYRNQLESDVRFWKDIFTRYDDNQYIIHDPEDLSIVYKVISFNPQTPDHERSRKIALEKYEVTKILLEIANKIEQGTALEKQERDMVRLFRKPPGSHQLKVYAHRVRAQQGIRNRFCKGVERSYAYIHHIKALFKDAQLPEELAYLPHVESSFNPRARSKSGAVGIWQFIPSTAKNFMKINAVIDERYDINKATKAACALLKLNYEETGDWGLAITAYNHGLNGMKRAAAQYGCNYLEVRKKYNSPTFQFASRNFYPEFLAAVDIMRNVATYFPDLNPQPMPNVIRYTLPTSVCLPALVRHCKLDLHLMQELNPAYTTRTWEGRVSVPAGYTLNLPARTDMGVLNAYISGQKNQYVAARPLKTTAKKPSTGDARSDIDKNPQASAQITTALTARDTTPTSITASGSATTKTDQAGPVATADLSLDAVRNDLISLLAVRGGTIRVFGDETVSHYAQWLNLPPGRILKINMLSPQTALRQRQTIRLDFSKVDPHEFQKRRIDHHIAYIETYVRQHNVDTLLNYKLGKGENLWTVALKQYNVPPHLVLYFNPQCDINTLHPGSVIRIPISKTRHTAPQNS